MKYLLVSLLLLGCAHTAPKPISLAEHIGVGVATQTEADKIIETLQSEVNQIETQPTATHGITMLELTGFDEATITGIENKITELRQSNTEIYLRLNTNGGSVFGMLNLVQFLEHEPVTCIVDYHAFSAGAYFLESAACKDRWATKRSTILFHEALTQETSGNQHQLRDEANELEALTDSIIGVTADRMKMSEEAFKAKIDNKVWIMSYGQALSAKAIDKIVDPKDLPAISAFPKPSLLQLLLGQTGK